MKEMNSHPHPQKWIWLLRKAQSHQEAELSRKALARPEEPLGTASQAPCGGRERLSCGPGSVLMGVCAEEESCRHFSSVFPGKSFQRQSLHLCVCGFFLAHFANIRLRTLIIRLPFAWTTVLWLAIPYCINTGYSALSVPPPRSMCFTKCAFTRKVYKPAFGSEGKSDKVQFAVMFLLLSVQGSAHGRHIRNFPTCYSWCLPSAAVGIANCRLTEALLSQNQLCHTRPAKGTPSPCAAWSRQLRNKSLLCQRTCLQCKNLLLSLIPSALERHLKFQKSEYCKQGKAMPILGWK